ncbi:DUF1641 domain-containing protein [uncultured Methanomethylovorans sp.]|jgi:uncharacterized protein YjgD (DUF1641 family)|uniref:DUF1641 domain-containing protein n=1 Tax=uncultured Methanomethylovorans sp. TaxID=183759 RepID=UPI002607A35F|nr:DUF1641 domain-containing protein [uncultured Methanomethylovorans sp.]
MTGENNADKISGIEITPTDVEAILDLARTVGILQNYINDETAHGIARLISTVLKITNTIMSTDLVDVMERGLQDSALDKALLDPPKIGLAGLLKQTQDEDFQKGMGIMVELIKSLGRATKDI